MGLSSASAKTFFLDLTTTSLCGTAHFRLEQSPIASTQATFGLLPLARYGANVTWAPVLSKRLKDELLWGQNTNQLLCNLWRG